MLFYKFSMDDKAVQKVSPSPRIHTHTHTNHKAHKRISKRHRFSEKTEISTPSHTPF